MIANNYDVFADSATPYVFITFLFLSMIFYYICLYIGKKIKLWHVKEAEGKGGN